MRPLYRVENQGQLEIGMDVGAALVKLVLLTIFFFMLEADPTLFGKSKITMVIIAEICS